MNLHAWHDWLKLASFAQEKTALPSVLFTPLRRHPDAYYTSCTTKIELNKPFRTTLEIATTFTKLGTVIV